MKNLIILFLILNINILYSNTIITGTVVGNNDMPLEMSHVHIFPLSDSTLIKSYLCNPKGEFNFSTELEGYIEIQFSGIFHKRINQILYLEKNIDTLKINVRLESYSYNTGTDSIYILGNFNKYSFNTAQLMKKEDNGTFSTTLNFPNDTLKYQLLNSTEDKYKRSANGTQANYFQYDGGGDYLSVIINKDSLKRVVFDPKLMPAKNKESFIQVENNKKLNHFVNVTRELLDKRKNYYSEFYNLRYSRTENEVDSIINIKILDLVKRKLIDVKILIKEYNFSPLLRILYLEYLMYASVPIVLNSNNIADIKIIKKALKIIEPTSILWYKWLPDPGFAFCASIFLGKNPKYFDSVINFHPITKVRTRSLLAAVEYYANMKPDKDLENLYYNKLMTEYPKSNDALSAEHLFNQKRKIQNGNKIPPFSVVQYDDSTKIITDASLKGKYALIDFWALWCGPCVAEIPNLHSAYEEFKNYNISFVSISLDREVKKLTTFRSKKWKLPWFNAIETDGMQSKICKDFEIYGIPAPILINPDGIIIATGDELMGDNLKKTLKKYAK